MRRLALLLAVVVLVFGVASAPRHLQSRTATNPDFVHFESGQVRPVAFTPSHDRLLVLNTPDDRLTVFDLTQGPPTRNTRIAEIPVGLEPVSVCALDDSTAWVVNNVSDDVSIVNLNTMHVKQTLRVGDEPNDVVFAGTPSKAYVSVSQEDAIKVYDPASLATAPVVIPIPGRTPRALARNLDGSEVLVDVFNSSAQSTSLSQAEAGDSLPPPNPPQSPGLPTAPKTGLAIKRNSVSGWVDQSGHLWNSKIPYSVPLVELVYVSTTSNTVLGARGDIASIMMGAATSPVTGSAAVTGTYAEIEIRLEPNIRGHFTEQRLAIVPSRTTARTEVGLNPQIVNYGVSPGPQSEADSAIGIPTGVCWSADGNRVYVSSLATNKLAVVNPGGAGTIVARVPTVAGPTGVIADPTRPRLYVVGRFHNQLQTLSTATLASVATAPIGFDPTPDAIVNGRKFFYGGFTSGHGDQACASCHLFGDMDNFAWELGNPQGTMAPPPPNMVDPTLQGFHPMKGPMVTQSLRGLINTGVLHWRGDRADLTAFNPAFVSLMGRSAVLPDSEMTAFGDFVLPLVYPPNPYQFLDRTYPDAPVGQPSALRGQTFFLNTQVDATLRCVDCHALPAGTNGQVIDHVALQESQDFKVPQLRNLYKKTGFTDAPGAVNKRGFGFTHDGSMDNLFDFLHFPGFNFGSPVSVADANRRDVERFLLDFDTGMAPAVGYQLTFDGGNNADATMHARMDTLEAQVAAGNCDLVAHGRIGGTPHGWMYAGGGQWIEDVAAAPAISRGQLITLAFSGHELTVTGVPSGSGTRMGLDRDRDGYRDGDELAAGTDPGDPASHPTTGVPMPGGGATGLRLVRPNPFQSSTSIDFALARDGEVTIEVFDVLGRTVRTVTRGLQTAGPHTVTWDGNDDRGRALGSGLYFVRMRGAEGMGQRPVLLVR